MSYKIIKPEITDVWGSVRKQAKNSWWFWGFVVGAIVELFIFGNFWILFGAMFYIMSATNKARDSFWKQVAEKNCWQYKGELDEFTERGIMFQQGKGRRIYHLIEGDVDGSEFRMFHYQFSVGEGKSETTYWYTVFAFKFDGSFPHIYLNNRHNSYNISIGENLPMPSEFEKQFLLSTPRKYETEALEIFTPDILTKLLDGSFTHDVEFVDHELMMFVEGSTDDFKKLEEEFNKAMELKDLLDEKLDKFKFEKIGDLPSIL
ncbi:MAG: hypothetical protein Q7K40_04145 [bacterium]|nr:hypothetical protein [bacterium]